MDFRDIGLFIARFLPSTFMALAHGYPKLASFSQYSESFPDPLGVSPLVSLCLVIFAELVCAALVAVGFFTRIFSIPLVITMLVAAFVIHGADPFGKKEMALLYGVIYLAVVFAGPGRHSLDYWIRGRA